MAKPDAMEDLRVRVKAQRRELKQLLEWVGVVEGVQTAQKALADPKKAGNLNLEIAQEGEVLFDFDLDQLPALKEDLLALFQRIEHTASEAVAEAEKNL